MIREVRGRIVIAQEDRVRLVDAEGRGYLLTVRKRVASLERLERWRDEGTPIRVCYSGVPDAGAVAVLMEPVVPAGRAEDGGGGSRRGASRRRAERVSTPRPAPTRPPSSESPRVPAIR